MKKISFFLLILSLNSQIYGQNRVVPTKFPTEFAENFKITLGSKVLLQLLEKTNGKYDYKILSIEPIDGYYSFKKNEELFAKEPQKNTIEIFFLGAFYNEGKSDKDFKSLLMLRSNLDSPLNYKADIKYYYKNEFESTSVFEAFPGTRMDEIWAIKIEFLTLHNFELLKK